MTIEIQRNQAGAVGFSANVNKSLTTAANTIECHNFDSRGISAVLHKQRC